jgi:hypothetical protein
MIERELVLKTIRLATKPHYLPGKTQNLSSMPMEDIEVGAYVY